MNDSAPTGGRQRHVARDASPAAFSFADVHARISGLHEHRLRTESAATGHGSHTNAAFAFGAGVFFVGYAIFEVPSNLLLHRVGAKLWMCRIMVTWGLVSAAMALAHSATTFCVALSVGRGGSGLLSRHCFIVYY